MSVNESRRMGYTLSTLFVILNQDIIHKLDAALKEDEFSLKQKKNLFFPYEEAAASS